MVLATVLDLLFLWFGLAKKLTIALARLPAFFLLQPAKQT